MAGSGVAPERLWEESGPVLGGTVAAAFFDAISRPSGAASLLADEHLTVGGRRQRKA